MRTSAVAWTLTALIVLSGLGWYVYANTTSGAYVAPTEESNTNVVTGPGPGYSGEDMAPTPSTPIATSTTSVEASTTVGVQ